MRSFLIQDHSLPSTRRRGTRIFVELDGKEKAIASEKRSSSMNDQRSD
jgi:hypothetical protein